MKITVDIADLMDELDLEELGLSLDPSPVTAGQVLDELTGRGVLAAGPRRNKRRPLRLAARAAVAAALVITLSVTAWAVGNYTDFFDSVFGDKGLESRESEKLPEPVQGSDIMPGQHFGTADTETAEAALAGYVTEVGKSVTAGGYTLTVENCLIDENGVGAIAYTVACPEGLPQINTFDNMLPAGLYTAADESGSFVLTVKAASGLFLDHYDILNAAETTDTVLHGVYYFQPLAREAGGGLGADDTLCIELKAQGPDGVTLECQDAIEISAARRAPSIELACGELTARLSPLSLVIRPPEGLEEPWGGASSRERVIRYRDGSEYVLDRCGEDEAEQNTIAAGVNGYTGVNTTIFNRFVDTAAVADVTVTASDGTVYVFRPAA